MPLPCDVHVISSTSRSTCTDNNWCKVESKLNVTQSNVQVPLVNSTIILHLRVTDDSTEPLHMPTGFSSILLFRFFFRYMCGNSIIQICHLFFSYRIAVLRPQRNTFCTHIQENAARGRRKKRRKKKLQKSCGNKYHNNGPLVSTTHWPVMFHRRVCRRYTQSHITFKLIIGSKHYSSQ